MDLVGVVILSWHSAVSSPVTALIHCSEQIEPISFLKNSNANWTLLGRGRNNGKGKTESYLVGSDSITHMLSNRGPDVYGQCFKQEDASLCKRQIIICPKCYNLFKYHTNPSTLLTFNTVGSCLVSSLLNLRKSFPLCGNFRRCCPLRVIFSL